MTEAPEDKLERHSRVEIHGSGRKGRKKQNDTRRAEKLELDPTDPLRIARLILEREYTKEEVRTLHHHADAFCRWNGRHYEFVAPQEVRSGIYSFLEKASRRNNKGGIVAFKPNMARVSNVIDALQAITNVPAAVQPPDWLEAGPVPATEVVACANGLLHLRTGNLMPSTPAFFSFNAVDFGYDKNAPLPDLWLKFLASLWDDDSKSIETLQEWSGYSLTADTRQQKILLALGRRAAAKGPSRAC